ncbi:hypothetical protein PENTCL1PPCAC_28213, partial [Pristionchus entomophagus]
RVVRVLGEGDGEVGGQDALVQLLQPAVHCVPVLERVFGTEQHAVTVVYDVLDSCVDSLHVGDLLVDAYLVPEVLVRLALRFSDHVRPCGRRSVHDDAPAA